VRIIGGPATDSIVSTFSTARIYIYDDKTNYFATAKNTKLHLSNDPFIHTYNYQGFTYDQKGFKPSIFYTNEDRLYVGLGYGTTHHAWNKEPFASKQLIDVHYSLMEKALSVTYLSLFPRVVGKWDLSILTNYDAIRWTNFFGLGNDAPFTGSIKYYRMRTEQFILNPGGTYRVGKNTFNVSGFFQTVRIIDDNDRFVSKNFTDSDPDLFTTHMYAGGLVRYGFHHLNDLLIPTRGFLFSVNGLFARNLKESTSFERFAGNVQFFIPLVSKFSFSVNTGAATVTGTPEFYQYASIGGPLLRGVRRDRYWGKTAFYNQNDLRFITNARTNFYKGKAGLLVFFDNGRVWMPSEKSNTWHSGYGAGITLAPFNKVYADVTYGFSSDGGLFQVRINRYF
jgi:hypothetical protein